MEKSERRRCSGCSYRCSSACRGHRNVIARTWRSAQTASVSLEASAPSAALIATPKFLEGIEPLREIRGDKGKDYARRFNHLLVSDDHTSSAYIRKLGNRIVSVVLPWNTGEDKGTFYSYRIVASFFHLVSPDYVLFLDGPVNPRGCCCVPHSATAPFPR